VVCGVLAYLNNLKCTFVFRMFGEERSDRDRELIASLFEFRFGGEDHDDVIDEDEDDVEAEIVFDLERT
jgi:hypothetical protein